MTQAKIRFQSFEEYLSYDDGTDNFYELFNGELVAVPPESGENVQIVNRLFLVFALLLETDRVRGHGLELEVQGEPKNRYPDLTIIREDHIVQLRQRNTIRLFMAPPQLVVEVASPGELQWERDYTAKRIQYEDCAIPEYWIIDPQTTTVLVLMLDGGDQYREFATFRGEQALESPQFGPLNLTAQQLFEGKAD